MTAPFHSPAWNPLRATFMLLLCLCTIAAFANRAAAQDYWTYLLHRETLASPLPFTVAQFSSFDRTGGNDDYANFYGTDPDGYRVLCDTTGPGVVAHFWFTALALSDTARWKIYVDDMSTPLIHATVRQLFGGFPPFVGPLADTVNYSRYSYVPIPFQQRIRITGAPHGGMYYHVNVLRFPPSWTVAPLTMPPSAAYLARLDSLEHLFLDPAQPAMPGAPVQIGVGTQTVAPGTTVTVLTVSQSGTCTRLTLHLDQRTQAVNDSVWASVFVDNYPLPVMTGPVSSLFGAALGWRPYQSSVTGMDGDSAYFNMPFPFRSALRVDVTNHSAQARIATAAARVVPEAPATVRPLRLHAVYRQETPTIPWYRYEVFDIPGPGQFVGLFWQMYNTSHATLEGDERLYFNGEATPSWTGTATEDYFNGGYFWTNDQGDIEAYQLASHGMLALGGGRAAAYRWHLMDPAPFTESLRMTMEPGGYSQYAVNYRTTALVYARVPRWQLNDLSGDGVLNYGESARLIGYGLPSGAVLSSVTIGAQPAEVISGNTVVTADSILDLWIRAPFSGAGSHPVIAVLGQPETVAAAYTLAAAPRLRYQPLRLEIDTLVFRGDTLSVRIDGVNPGETATVTAADIPFAWASAIPVADSTGQLTGNAIVPAGLPAGDLMLSAISSGMPPAEGERPLRHRRFLRCEAEGLPVAAWHGALLRDRWALVYAFPNQSYPWGRNIVRYLDGNAIGDSLSVSFVFADSGQFRFAYFFAASGGAAIVQTQLDGEVDLAGVDTYAPNLGWRIARMDTVYGPWRTLAPGPHVLTFKVVGRNPSATSHDIWLDQFLILHEYPVNDAGHAAVAGGYALDQNYPNPFNPSTRIRFTIPRDERVTVKVYDVLGREAAVLADRTFTAGEHFLTWDCAACASGIYFLHLSTPSRRFVRKMAVLR